MYEIDSSIYYIISHWKKRNIIIKDILFSCKIFFGVNIVAVYCPKKNSEQNSNHDIYVFISVGIRIIWSFGK